MFVGDEVGVCVYPARGIRYIMVTREVNCCGLYCLVCGCIDIGSVVRWLAAGGAFILQAFALLRRAAGRRPPISHHVVGWMARDFFLNESEDLLCGGK